jgi:hypothetical protein
MNRFRTRLAIALAAPALVLAGLAATAAAAPAQAAGLGFDCSFSANISIAPGVTPTLKSQAFSGTITLSNCTSTTYTAGTGSVSASGHDNCEGGLDNSTISVTWANDAGTSTISLASVDILTLGDEIGDVSSGADAGAVVDEDETSDTNEVGMCTNSSPLTSLTTSGTVAFLL